MDAEKKLVGETRRASLIEWLQQEGGPLTGSYLAKKAAVSRQVIVQDISLLKARGEPITATIQGYLYVPYSATRQKEIEIIVACKHAPEQAEEELLLIVDCGVTIKNVIIEHIVYGELTAELRLSTRKDVATFLERINETGASYLSELTEGVHLHMLCATERQRLENAVAALDAAGILIKD
ncbi:transcription repressor NadR [Xenorhabdus budapestensis]|uniref:Transcription repressor NadR n=1 Tax=Xenorhabdus budapestensis TaxID=290110 RepID=A0A2D0J2Z6_XENBU|nr:transcription repressor NadR [Xenorhabdus budapestensis]PHM28732.1 Transcription repressor NadR [Xenorhabdus budapestensis]QTL38274.1 transcription repressor NadR [Xenorhabdus budapestensis]